MRFKWYIVGFHLALAFFMFFEVVFLVPSNQSEQLARIALFSLAAGFSTIAYGAYKEAKWAILGSFLIDAILFIPNPLSLLVLPFMLLGMAPGLLSTLVGPYLSVVLGHFVMLIWAYHSKWG